MTETIIVDDPLRRPVETTRDQGEKDVGINKLLLDALENARNMPVLQLRITNIPKKVHELG
jgi:hypothetical protein